MKSRLVAVFLASLLIFTSCSKLEKAAPSRNAPASAPVEATAAGFLETKAAKGGNAETVAADATAEMANAGEKPDTEKNLAVRGRKLYREGQLVVKVKDVDQSRQTIEKMVGKAGGFISNVQYHRETSNRVIELTLRLPAEGFLPFIDAVRSLGFVTDENFNVIDVTDQYVDLGRRVSTNEKIAARLEELIKERGYQFKDLLAVQQELARLQMENEQLKGSLQGLDDRIALSTLRVRMFQEIEQQVVPPDSAFAPLVSAVENAGPQFRRSVHAITSVASALINAAIWLAPWSIPAAILWFAIKAFAARRRRKRGKAAAAAKGETKP